MKILFRGGKHNLRVGHYIVSPNELNSCLLLNYTVREKAGRAGENKTSCVRESRASEEIWKGLDG